MKKALAWKFALIAAVVILALIEVYPPAKKLKQGLDLAGGTSLIYEIDTADMKDEDARDIASKMITVLRRRVDPDGVRNLIWRPLGNKRLEIQMPLASKEAQKKRTAYEKSLEALLSKNISEARIMRSLVKPAAERAEDFNDFAAGSEVAGGILAELATAYDERQEARTKAEAVAGLLDAPLAELGKTGMDTDEVEASVGFWTTVDGNDRTAMIKAYLGDNYSAKNLTMLERYAATYSQWSQAVELLTDPETGRNIKYQRTKDKLRELVLTEDELKNKLNAGDAARKLAVEELKEQYPDRTAQIDAVVLAYEEYKEFQGRLDDPKDLQRMLKGAGILEFRILPTIGEAKSDTDLLEAYIQNLKEKGPKFASDDKYVWCPIENHDEWFSIDDRSGMEQLSVRDKQGRPCVVAEFGGREYVLASNKPDEVMLHGPEKKPWKLQDSKGTRDDKGRRAIGFSLDVVGAKYFSNLTGGNIERPLCILLDGIAISAPHISTRIGGSGIISGRFTQEKVDDMVDKLNAGSLPGRLIEQPVSVKTIGPSIGADNRDQGIRAAEIGLVIVILVMLGYYYKAGLIADLALVLNVLVILAVMVVLQATFTLPGIAGMILTIGMSVDANVLIFERIREEQTQRVFAEDSDQKRLSKSVQDNSRRKYHNIHNGCYPLWRGTGRS